MEIEVLFILLISSSEIMTIVAVWNIISILINVPKPISHNTYIVISVTKPDQAQDGARR